MQSIVKLKINHKVETGKSIPWELIYLIKKGQEKIGKRLFKYHLIVKSEKEIKGFLKNVNFETLSNQGMTREEIFETPLTPKKKLSELMDIEDYSLLIPILARGKKSGRKSLRYLASKMFRRTVKDSASSRKPIEMPQVIISAGDNLEGLPCTNCSNLHAKLVDDKACQLGSAQCLTNIMIGKGSDFNTSLTMKEGSKK
jgi:hypothetical protein